MGIEKLKNSHFDVDIRAEMSQEELRAVIGDYDALIVRSATQVTEEIINGGQKLKIIGRAGIGLDNVDVGAATRKGIIVANAPQSNVVSAAEHAITLLLAQCRNVPQANSSLRSGKWERKKFEGVEVSGKTLGIVGLGRVGTVVAKQALGLGMDVIAYDPYVSEERFRELKVDGTENLYDLLKVADFISFHLPKTKETQGMIGGKEFAAMKDGVRIVNTARGGIMEEKALIKALKEGKVASCALDVFEKEPLTKSPLFKFNQVIVTPHLGASTQEAQDRAGITIAEQVIAALKGEFVSYAVNIDAPAVEEKVKPFLPLVEKLGRLFTSISEGSPINEIEIEYAGNLHNYNISILTVAALKGLFTPVVTEPVTYVNAPIIAAERGIEVKEIKTATSRGYVDVITIRGKDRAKELSVGGTLVGKNKERFVSIYDFDIDMVPSKYMAFFRYADLPGMIGIVGTILGKSGINIANMQVGRRVIGGEALMGINVDTPIPESVMREIQKKRGFSRAKFLIL